MATAMEMEVEVAASAAAEATYVICNVFSMTWCIRRARLISLKCVYNIIV